MHGMYTECMTVSGDDVEKWVSSHMPTLWNTICGSETEVFGALTVWLWVSDAILKPSNCSTSVH